MIVEKDDIVVDEDDYVYVKKVLDFKENGKGCLYNYKLRNLYYFFRSRNIGVYYIGFVLEVVLDIFNISVNKLLSKSIVFVLMSEMGVLSRCYLNEEFLNSSNIIMYRDVIIKKGYYFYVV